MQNNSKCRLYRDRDETINHTISEYSKLAQNEYKPRHDWVGKVIHWKLYKGLELDNAYKLYMHKPEFMQKNEMHKILWNSEI